MKLTCSDEAGLSHSDLPNVTCPKYEARWGVVGSSDDGVAWRGRLVLNELNTSSRHSTQSDLVRVFSVAPRRSLPTAPWRPFQNWTQLMTCLAAQMGKVMVPTIWAS